MPIPSLTSRYIGVPIVTDADGRELYEIRRPMRAVNVAGIQLRAVGPNELLHHVAFNEYGDAQLWWAIADFNDIADPTTELVPGTTILIPPRLLIDQHLTLGA